jgi:CDP-diacylglycerol--inositol 3-phosphatidyltransferase
MVGYARIIMAIAAYHYIQEPAQFFSLYAISCLLDAVDGHAARFLGQCTPSTINLSILMN